MQRAIDVDLRAGVVLEPEQHFGVQTCAPRDTSGLTVERRAQQRVAARLAVGLQPPRRAEQRARVVRIGLQHFVERLLRVVEVVLCAGTARRAGPSPSSFVGSTRRRAVVRLVCVLEQLRIVLAEVLARRSATAIESSLVRSLPSERL